MPTLRPGINLPNDGDVEYHKRLDLSHWIPIGFLMRWSKPDSRICIRANVIGSAHGSLFLGYTNEAKYHKRFVLHSLDINWFSNEMIGVRSKKLSNSTSCNLDVCFIKFDST